MKRQVFLKRLRQIAKARGLELDVREGANHTVVRIGNQVQTVPRHSEINEITAKSIIRGLEER